MGRNLELSWGIVEWFSPQKWKHKTGNSVDRKRNHWNCMLWKPSMSRRLDALRSERAFSWRAWPWRWRGGKKMAPELLAGGKVGGGMERERTEKLNWIFVIKYKSRKGESEWSYGKGDPRSTLREERKGWNPESGAADASFARTNESTCEQTGAGPERAGAAQCERSPKRCWCQPDTWAANSVSYSVK